MYSNIIDISQDQGVIDWDELKAQTEFPIVAVIAKATEGLTLIDPMFRQYHDNAKRVGIPLGAYHYFHGDDDGEAQANRFLDATDGYGGPVLPGVDCEQNGSNDLDGVSVEEYLGQLGAFRKVITKTLNDNKHMLIYFEYSFWANTLNGFDGFSGSPAWPAAYSNATSLDMTGTGWNNWTMWQWSDGSNVPNIRGINAHVDRSRIRTAQLSAIMR